MPCWIQPRKMDSISSYLAKKTNVKELNVEIQVKGRYSQVIHSRQQKDSIISRLLIRNLGLIVIGEGDCSIKPTLPVFEKVPMMQ